MAFLTVDGNSAKVLLYLSTMNKLSYPNPFLPFSSKAIVPSQVPLTTNSLPSGNTTAMQQTNLPVL